jgi:hypothetical protein
MKLDRNNINGDGRGKYGLIRNRRIKQLLETGNVHVAAAVQQALDILEQHDVINWGTGVDDEFFVMMLKDRFTSSGLQGYAINAFHVDPEYGADIFALAARSGPYHPAVKMPD